jgi:hypothetical protein
VRSSVLSESELLGRVDFSTVASSVTLPRSDYPTAPSEERSKNGFSL